MRLWRVEIEQVRSTAMYVLAETRSQAESDAEDLADEVLSHGTDDEIDVTCDWEPVTAEQLKKLGESAWSGGPKGAWIDDPEVRSILEGHPSPDVIPVIPGQLGLEQSSL